jgi:hypothetical protein
VKYVEIYLNDLPAKMQKQLKYPQKWIYRGLYRFQFLLHIFICFRDCPNLAAAVMIEGFVFAIYDRLRDHVWLSKLKFVVAEPSELLTVDLTLCRDKVRSHPGHRAENDLLIYFYFYLGVRWELSARGFGTFVERNIASWLL